ncbi:MAG TPA: tRNA (adenosine(37)-N6)-dimethylallyltransferase MiaA [Edaphobacter sp.]|uniref:tRNA (adenosine(37)-N6)-dimethylallyltransferase MiaA n=1 Tax=Edaphobacter sp. TaxID=1934404 RepID=UPI002B7B6D5A|nr:tRNA (adenosine(37)-N6)-dimethylallyltransferase MiaA [Edaphobacter sp.]HUZ95182.1 tRNA (adenosine(37)-N6)-dimethylallyltransferase MiaA [Edaphobacter sp.]
MVTSPLIVLVGPTASGKTALALRLAEQFNGEIVSCDSVAVYREMEIGTAKPSLEERAFVPHHMIDIAWPDEACTAGDYSRQARESLAGITERGHLPIVAGGTGLYLRALIDGLFPSPPAHPGRREVLRQRAETHGAAYLHRLLTRLDPAAAAAIHANDVSKVVRAIEVSLAAKQPLTEQWEKGRDALTGFKILRLGLEPPRPLLYERINHRAAAMFDRGLVEETERLIGRYGRDCRPLTSLGYAEASAVLRNELTRDQAVAQAQQGHRNYAKRQATWFRRDTEIHWLKGFGNQQDIVDHARQLTTLHLKEK